MTGSLTEHRSQRMRSTRITTRNDDWDNGAVEFTHPPGMVSFFDLLPAFGAKINWHDYVSNLKTNWKKTGCEYFALKNIHTPS
jgi:hypothetical protein